MSCAPTNRSRPADLFRSGPLALWCEGRKSCFELGKSVKYLFDPSRGVRVEAVNDNLRILEGLRCSGVRCGGLNALSDHDDRQQDQLKEGLCDPRHHQDEARRSKEVWEGPFGKPASLVKNRRETG